MTPGTAKRIGAMTTINAELRTFLDRVIVPALVDRFLREQAAVEESAKRPTSVSRSSSKAAQSA